MIGEDDMPSRSGTPRPADLKRQTTSEPPTEASPDGTENTAQEKAATKEAATSELSTDVRVKLRKLDKLESKYHGSSILHARARPILNFCRATAIISDRPCPGPDDRTLRNLFERKHASDLNQRSERFSRVSQQHEPQGRHGTRRAKASIK